MENPSCIYLTCGEFFTLSEICENRPLTSPHAILVDTLFIDDQNQNFHFYVSINFISCLVVGEMLELKAFGISDLDYLVDHITLPILVNTEIFLHSILICTQPNDLPTMQYCQNFDTFL